MIDENEFFREATSRICGSLEIEVALFECLRYLKSVIHVENMYLGFWDPDIRSIRVIARATDKGGMHDDSLIPLTPNAIISMENMQKSFNASSWPDTDIINEPSRDPGMGEIAKHLRLEDSPMMHLILETIGRPLCSVLVVGPDKTTYAKEDGQILNLLKRPLSIAMSNALKHREVVKLKELLVDDNRYLHRELRQISGYDIVGSNFGLKDVMDKAGQVAPLNSPVLLLGETGVGKDVIANAIHYSSNRREGPFIKVNCGAIPESLLDSELFGHEKGAFTGALSQKRGRFERAHKGTILLDEIGEMPLDAQVRLLRVLQNREIERIGGTESISLDIRIIAATNKNLEEEVLQGRFRKDLWFRINVFPIVVPPLRHRTSDIPALAHHFVDRKTKELKIGKTPCLADGAVDVLMAYDWPGNVRELENIIERAMILHQGKPLRFDELGAASQSPVAPTSTTADPQSLALDEVNARHIKQVLEMTSGKIHGPGGAGELLGVNPNTLRTKMKKLGIQFQKYPKAR